MKITLHFKQKLWEKQIFSDHIYRKNNFELFILYIMIITRIVKLRKTEKEKNLFFLSHMIFYHLPMNVCDLFGKQYLYCILYLSL